MTGPEHYQTAEDLLRSPGLDSHGLAEAQVHATLALAAAMALGARQSIKDWTAWVEVAR